MIEEDFWSAPDSWSMKKFENVSRTVSGKAFDSTRFSDENKDGYTPVIRIRDIHNTDTESYTDEDFETKYQIESGNLLVGMDGEFEASFWKGGNAALNQRVLKIETAKSVRTEWIKFWLDIVLPHIHKQVPKATVKHLSVQKHLNPSVIPVPPLDEQERIVRAVEERLERVERLEKSVENVGKLADEYQNSLVASLLASKDDLNEEVQGGVPTEDDIPNNWRISKISDEAKVILGNSPPGESYNDTGEGPPFIQGAGAFGEESPKTDRFTSEPTKKCEEGDTIIAIRATIGDLNKADKEYCLGRGVAGIRAGDEILQDYLHMYLEAIDELDYWREVSTGATFNSITKTNIQELSIPVPPLEIQEEIIEKKSNINFATIEKSASDVSRLFDEYSDSVLAHAFQGEYSSPTN